MEFEALRLRDDFPPVATAEWEAAIRKDLNGAGYENLLWPSDEGITVRPYYRREDLSGLEGQIVPGMFSSLRSEERARSEAIRADLLHEAGANAVQQLSSALAEGVERLIALTQRYGSVDQAAEEIEFVFDTGPIFFFEIAKLRAARLLWAQVM